MSTTNKHKTILQISLSSLGLSLPMSPMLPHTLGHLLAHRPPHHLRVVHAIHRHRPRRPSPQRVINRLRPSSLHQLHVRLLAHLLLTLSPLPHHAQTPHLLAHRRQRHIPALLHDRVQRLPRIFHELSRISVARRRRYHHRNRRN